MSASRPATTRRAFQPVHTSVGATPQRKRTLWLALGAMALLVGIAAWTYDAVRESLDELVGDQLQAMVDASASVLALWADNETRNVSAWAELPSIRAAVVSLAAINAKRSGDRDALVAAQTITPLLSALRGVTDEGDLRGYLIAAPDGVVIAAENMHAIGRRMSSARMADFAPVFAGEARVLHPFDDVTILPDLRPELPIMGAAAPIRNDDGAVIALLAFRIDPALDFSQIFKSSRIGSSGETYAFNKDGVMLSSSRFEAELKSIGLVSSDRVGSSILSVQVRDPGGDLGDGYTTDTPLAARPLTRMAAAAVTGGSGVDLGGYRDYRGIKVMGAWRWLPEFDLGIATEMDVREVYRVLRPLGLALAGLFVLLLASIVTLLLSYLALSRLKRRVQEVEQLGQYRLVEKIGEGGMATVYRAEHALLRRPTAVKLLKPDVVNEETLERFEREVQLTSELTHPNTIAIYDYGHTPDGLFYYAMEYLDGISLSDLLVNSGAMPAARVVQVLIQICGSLLEAHERGSIHRDVKPPNVMLCSRGGQGEVAKLLDFGLVKDIVTGVDPELTASDVVAGTPQYIAPERIQDPDNVDQRADLYSVGAVGFNLLTAQDVFSGATGMEIVHHVLNTPPPRPSDVTDAEIPPALDALIASCLAKDPAERPASAAVMIEQLETIARDRPWTRDDARRWWDARSDNARG